MLKGTLILTFSLGEKELPADQCRVTDVTLTNAASSPRLPLPEGEGWGEGPRLTHSSVSRR
jgi:hypothetical protein